MWNYQILKEKFFGLANGARTNANDAKLKRSKAPEVFEGLHDVDLARHDVYMYLATSHYPTRQDFLDALNQLAVTLPSNTEAFDEQKYLETRKNIISGLIAEFQ
jgi:hypothetical protein